MLIVEPTSAAVMEHLLELLRAGALVLGGGLAAACVLRLAGPRTLFGLLGALAVANLALMAFLWVNHVPARFPLETMEMAVLQHAQRVLSGLPIYPVPDPSYVPLAYNSLYYLVAAPFLAALGSELSTMRIVAIVGIVLAGAAIYAALARASGSRSWGLIAVGLFAAAYRAMDASLDTAHSDSWLLACAVSGTFLIDRARTPQGRTLGLVVLVAGFWFKQHGAVFVGAALLYLTWREGLRSSVGYWATVLALGPLPYLAARTWPFGSRFHYFTFAVPSGWSEPSARMVARVGLYVVTFFAVPAAAAALLLGRVLQRPRDEANIWHVQLLAAGLTAVLGALDPGSSDNVFAPLATFLLVTGTMALHRLAASEPARARVAPVALASAFAALAYDPRTVLVPANANAAYDELIAILRDIGGPVFAPGLVQTADRPLFYPSASWVALEDIARGHGRTASDSALALRVVVPAMRPNGRAYLLSEARLDQFAYPLTELRGSYVLQEDFGDRFRVLAGLPHRFPNQWPRYLYRYATPTTQAYVP